MQSISEFIERWAKSGGSERANYALFLTELAEVLGVEKPLPATDTDENDHYRLERPVASHIIGETSKKFIDFYRRGSFILKTKQGSQAKSTDTNQLTLPTIPKVKRVGQVVAVRDALAELGKATPEQLARTFKHGRTANVMPLLESMMVMGSVSKSDDETYRPTR